MSTLFKSYPQVENNYLFQWQPIRIWLMALVIGHLFVGFPGLGVIDIVSSRSKRVASIEVVREADPVVYSPVPRHTKADYGTNVD